MKNPPPIRPIAGQHHWHRTLLLLVLAVSLCATYASWRIVTASFRLKAQSAFSGWSGEITGHLSARLHTHEELLLGGLGLFNAKGEVTRDEWRRYVSAIELEESSPGILGIGYAAWMTPAEKEANVQRIRAEGFSEYTIRPSGRRSVYTSTIYLEPFNSRNQRAFGYDMYTEPNRRAAMDTARDTGKPAITGKTTLVQETAERKQSGFLMYIPVYRLGMPVDTVEGRRAAMRGFVFSPIRVDDFVYGTLQRPPSSIAFEIFDGPEPLPGKRMFSSLHGQNASVPENYRPVFESTTRISSYGRTWTLCFRTLPSFNAELNPSLAWAVLFGGLVVSSLVCAIAYMLSSTRQKAISLATQMTQELRESERRFRSMADAAPELIWMTDSEHRCIWVNRRWIDFTGRTLEQELDRGWMQGVHPLDLDVFRDYSFPAIGARQMFTDEFRLRRADGVYRWLLNSGMPRLDEQGSFVGYIGSCIDITERKELESELKLASFSMDSMQDAVFWVLPNGRIWNVNAAACRVTGYTHSELITRTLFEINSDYTPEFWGHYWTDLKRNGSMSFQRSFRTKDGRIIPIEITANYIAFSGQEYDCAIVRDITDRAQAELMKERMLLRQRAILDNLPMLAWLKDGEARFEMVNEAFANACGLPAADIIGKTAEDVLPPHMRELCGAESRIPASGVRSRMETPVATPQGPKWYLCHITRLLDESGQVVGIAGIALDISDQKRYEQKLLQAREAAEEASRSKSDFIAHISHEIRTPMNGVVGMNQLLLVTQLDARQRRCAEMVRDSAAALLAIIDDLLDLSKIEAGKLELERIDFNLQSVVEGVADLVAVKAHEKGLELLCRIDPEVPTLLRGDPGRLRQILVNLVGNAVKFTETGEVTVRARVESVTTSVRLRFDVRDTGIGIPAAKQGVLFQPFSQADASTRRRFGGTGLGLSIVRKLVGMMGGTVACESQEGRGSCFWFTAEFEMQEDVPAPRPLSLAGRRILVVHQNSTGRSYLAELLESWLCRTETVPDTAAALARLRSESSLPLDVVMVDVDVPESYRIGQAISEDQDLAGLPILVMTDLERTANWEQWRSIGFGAKVAKPIKQSELVASLETVLGCIGPFALPAAPAPDRRSRHGDADRSRRRILVVEDNPTNQAVLEGMLRVLGYVSITLADDGKQALDRLVRADFDLILMDCQLPGMDGYETCRVIRARGVPVRNPNVPIIAVTAHAMQSDRARCLEAGMNDYTVKPVMPATLEQLLDKWLRPEAAPPPPQAPAETAAAFRPDDLVERLMGNVDSARRVVSTFLSDMPVQLAALSRAVNEANAESARMAAHTIKGAAANAGGPLLRDKALRIESAVGAGDVSAARDLFPELAAGLERYRAEAERFLEDRTA